MENMVKVTYGSEEGCWFDYDAGRVWSADFKRFAIVADCPYCGQLIGTGLAYRADEPEYNVADEYVSRVMGEHLRFAHPEIFEDE